MIWKTNRTKLADLLAWTDRLHYILVDSASYEVEDYMCIRCILLSFVNYVTYMLNTIVKKKKNRICMIS